MQHELVENDLNQGSESIQDLATFFEIVDLAETGDESAQQEVRNLIENDPKSRAALGDLTSHLRLKLIRQVSGDELLRREAIESNLNVFLARVESENLQHAPETIKQLLRDLLGMAWLELHLVEAQYSTHRNRRMVQRFWGDQLKASQRRYLAALQAVVQTGQRYAA